MQFDPKYPLILDVDGTLIRNDLTHDLLIRGISKYPFKILRFLRIGLTDKSQMKSELVGLVGDEFNTSSLPYNQTILSIAKAHHEAGGEVALCSGSHQTLIDKIKNQFSWISAAYGTSTGVNLTKENKRDFLSERYPDGFHYIGNSTQDFPIWEKALTGAAINPPKSISTVKTASQNSVEILEQARPSFKTYLKCIRIHQWVKNLLLGLVPLLTLSNLTPLSIINVIIGFFAISFLSSATYVLNDLLDAPEDRQHPSKRNRPIASGTISLPLTLLVIASLFLLSLGLTIWLPTSFFAVLSFYFIATMTYSFFLKKVVIIDVIVLAGLFTLRVIAGAALSEQPVSPWLLNFIASFFLSLALVKRYTEIRKKTEGAKLLGRGYEKGDEPLLLNLGIMATGMAILNLLLYTSLAVNAAIESLGARFLLLTVLTYWLMRIWLLAHRKELNDDPVLFAIKDKVSLSLGTMIALVVLAEQFSIL